jgi:GNAT superfamily N-acetyltransferase
VTGPHLRQPIASDFDEVFPLLQQLWPNRELDSARLRDVFLEALSSPAEAYLIAETDGRVVGFGSLAITNSLWTAGRLAFLNELVVDQAHRGRGVGTVLLEALSELARRRGCNRIELASSPRRTAAHRFYEERGYQNRGYVFSKEL